MNYAYVIDIIQSTAIDQYTHFSVPTGHGAGEIERLQ